MIKKQKNLDEISVAGGGIGSVTTDGDVEGPSSPLGSKKRKFKMPEGYYTSRTQFVEELELRKTIKEFIKKAVNKKILVEQKQLNEEKELRSLIKILLKEAKKDIETVPHPSTAINLLEEMLKQILPNLETDYKTLTTKKEQRDSFRAHVVNAVSDLLETEDVNKAGGTKGEEGTLLNLEEDEELEEVEIKVSDVDATADDKFIDIEPEEEIPEEEEDTFGLEGQDETGRALAQEAFNNIEKNITETYAILHDDEDEKLFKDYLITNLKLYFDKWEQELGAVTEPTTDEYEAEKDAGKAGAEAGAELGGEFGGETPAPAGSEEVI